MKKRKLSPLRVILRILGCLLLALVLAVAVVMYVIPACEHADRTAVAGTADWMKDLEDDLPISAVVLPGTHDSATKNVQLAYFSKCQSLSIGEQLDAGYRYLDIRLAVDGDSLKFMHGFTNCTENGWPWAKPLTLDAVLTDCYRFLEEHPSEFVVFAVKQEHGDEPTAVFEQMLADKIAEQPEHWLLTDTLPTVGEVRGRLVLMRRYEDEAALGTESGIPMLWSDQGNRENFALNIVSEQNASYTLWVQDRYKYDAADKWAAFTAGLEAGETGTDAVSLHFLSTNGNTTYGHPYKYARVLNQQFRSSSLPLSGWIAVDFASPAMAEQIYSANF